jgi:hypothetical protein
MQFGPPDDEHLLIETCRGVKNKYIKKECSKLAINQNNWDNQITAGFSDLVEAAENNTQAYVHLNEKSTKLTHTLELTDTKDFFHGVLKFNTLRFRNMIGPCFGARVFQLLHNNYLHCD